MWYFVVKDFPPSTIKTFARIHINCCTSYTRRLPCTSWCTLYKAPPLYIMYIVHETSVAKWRWHKWASPGEWSHPYRFSLISPMIFEVSGVPATNDNNETHIVMSTYEDADAAHPQGPPPLSPTGNRAHLWWSTFSSATSCLTQCCWQILDQWHFSP